MPKRQRCEAETQGNIRAGILALMDAKGREIQGERASREQIKGHLSAKAMVVEWGDFYRRRLAQEGMRPGRGAVLRRSQAGGAGPAEAASLAGSLSLP